MTDKNKTKQEPRSGLSDLTEWLALLPCPFCGGEAKEEFIDGSIWCTKCSGGVTDFTKSDDELRYDWNMRANV